MQKTIVLLFICFLFLSSQAFGQINVQGKLSSCDRDTLAFFEMDGLSLRAVAKIPLTKQEEGFAFSFAINEIPKGFYLFGGGQQKNTRWMILGDEPVVTLVGECNTLSQAQIVNSPDNQLYDYAMNRANTLAQEFSREIGKYRSALHSQSQVAIDKVEAEMKRTDAAKVALLDSVTGIDPFVGKALALKTYLSFQHHGEGYAEESEYLAKAYFQMADLSDGDYDRIPNIRDAFQAYATAVSSIGLSHEEQITYTNLHIDAIPEKSRARKTALLGLVAGFSKKNEDALIHYADQYMAEYPNDDPRVAGNLQKETAQARIKMIGAVAPDISLPNPDGDTLSISGFKGKVLLLDFWASWCGPCRRENPRVVKMYNKYKDEGFEILGISLDRSHGPWVEAIEKDGLDWYHMSDLKFWQSIASRTYGVGSIPYTVLLDREGRIVAKNLRGEKLEAKVAELLGVVEE